MAAIVIQPGMAAAMVKFGFRKRWPALFTFLCFRSTVSVLLLIISLVPETDFTAAAYFYAYWGAAGFACFIRVWMVEEMINSTSPTARVRRFVRIVVPIAAVLFVAPAVLLSSHGPVPVASELVKDTVNFNRVISITWVLTFAVLAYACEYLGPRWTGRDRMIAAGLAFQATSELVTSWLLGVWTPGKILSDLHDLSYLASLGIWLFAFIQREPPTEIPDLRTAHKIAQPYAHVGTPRG